MKILNVSKFFLKLIFSCLFFYLLLDLTVATILYNKSNYEHDKIFLKKWPVALRSVFYSYNIPKPDKQKLTGNLNYSSLLAFFNPNLIAIISDGKVKATLDNLNDFKSLIHSHKKSGGKIFIALGSSTTAITQKSNWPFAIEDLIDKNTLIINAGHNAYSSYQASILLFDILLPLMNPYLPDEVVAMTGVSDINKTVSSLHMLQKYNFSEVYKASLLHNSYLLNDIKHNSKSKFLTEFKIKLVNSDFLFNIFPSIINLINYLEPLKPSKLFNYLGSVNNKNIFEICKNYVVVEQSIGSLIPDEIITSEKKGINRFNSFTNLIDNKKEITSESFIKNIKECLNQRQKEFENKKTLYISKQDIHKIINQILLNELRIFSTLKSLGIPYMTFLQPINKESFSPNKSIPGFDYNLIQWYMRGSPNGIDMKFDSSKILRELSIVISKEPYNSFFKKINYNKEVLMNKDGYIIDNIHYQKWFSKVIAKDIHEQFLKNKFNDKSVKKFELLKIKNTCNDLLIIKKTGVNYSSHKDRSPESQPYNMFNLNKNDFWETNTHLPVSIFVNNNNKLFLINKYSFKSGVWKESISRMPIRWKFYGSIDNKKWEIIDEQYIDEKFKKNETKVFKINNNKFFKTYKFELLENLDSKITRIKNIELFGCLK